MARAPAPAPAPVKRGSRRAAAALSALSLATAVALAVAPRREELAGDVPDPVVADPSEARIEPSVPRLDAPAEREGDDDRPEAPDVPLGEPVGRFVVAEGRFWQHEGRGLEDPTLTDRREGNRGACPAGMVEVKGKMKVAKTSLDQLQHRACVEWITRKAPERCARYDAKLWKALSAHLPTTPMHFCMDRYEYPNVLGAFPVVMASWYEAKAACERRGRRLCGEDEWTFACEGEEARPYATGYVREPEVCGVDRPEIQVDTNRLYARGPATAAELARLWQGSRSGARAACRSPFGVHDLTGNVDEWTTASKGFARQGAFKGGYWGKVRARCRPATRAHEEAHAYYQEGFRCCADAPGVTERRPPASP